MSYVMKNENEANRLEEQSKNEHFSPEKELERIEIIPGSKILDAGCGSGTFSNMIKLKSPTSNIEACDIDHNHIVFAKQKQATGVKFFQYDILEHPLVEKYDHIFNRYVAHHFNEENYTKILLNLFNSLSDNGKLTVIDFDGLYSHIGSTNKDLKGFLELIHSNFHGDLTLAKKIPSLMEKVGFKKVSWDIEIQDFKDNNRMAEVEQWQARIENAFPFYVQVLGSEFEANRFKKLYLGEISNSNVPLFYNKFIITAQK